jgi:hypothetical protein
VHPRAAVGPALTKETDVALARSVEIKAAIWRPLDDLLRDEPPDHLSANQQVPRNFT